MGSGSAKYNSRDKKEVNNVKYPPGACKRWNCNGYRDYKVVKIIAYNVVLYVTIVSCETIWVWNIDRIYNEMLELQ